MHPGKAGDGAKKHYKALQDAPYLHQSKQM
jgi:hypothetical protein